MLELQNEAAQLDLPFSSLELVFQQSGPGQAEMEGKSCSSAIEVEKGVA